MQYTTVISSLIITLGCGLEKLNPKHFGGKYPAIPPTKAGLGIKNIIAVTKMITNNTFFLVIILSLYHNLSGWCGRGGVRGRGGHIANTSIGYDIITSRRLSRGVVYVTKDITVNSSILGKICTTSVY